MSEQFELEKAELKQHIQRLQKKGLVKIHFTFVENTTPEQRVWAANQWLTAFESGKTQPAFFGNETFLQRMLVRIKHFFKSFVGRQ